MAEKVYANLLGEWVRLSDDENAVIGTRHLHLETWWEENADIYSPINKPVADTFYHESYVMVHYRGKDYRIHPTHIQVVTE